MIAAITPLNSVADSERIDVRRCKWRLLPPLENHKQAVSELSVTRPAEAELARTFEIVLEVIRGVLAANIEKVCG